MSLGLCQAGEGIELTNDMGSSESSKNFGPYVGVNLTSVLGGCIWLMNEMAYADQAQNPR